jgi:hypothetical protein
MSFTRSARETWQGRSDEGAWERLGLTAEEIWTGHKEEMARALIKIAGPPMDSSVEVEYIGMGLMEGDLKALPGQVEHILYHNDYDKINHNVDQRSPV